MNSSLPVKFNFDVWQTGTWIQKITFIQGTLGSAPVDLTNYQGAVFNIYAPQSTPQTLPAYTATVGNGITLGGVNGTITIVITESVISRFTWTNGTYSLGLIDPSGNDIPLMWGDFNIQNAFTP